MKFWTMENNIYLSQYKITKYVTLRHGVRVLGLQSRAESILLIMLLI